MNAYYNANSVQLIHSGRDYFHTLEGLLTEAKHTVHLHTYIFEADETGKQVVQYLINAAQRGVQVYVLIDAFGSHAFPDKLSSELQAAGVHFRFFGSFFSGESKLPWRRLHHKLVLIDAQVALIGGINIANKYNDTAYQTAWLDYATLVKGPVCTSLSNFCFQFYFKKRIKPIRVAADLSNSSPGSSQIRFRRNDFMIGKNEIHKSYVEALLSAKSSITIVASYFLPGANFRKLLRRAAERGVKIKLIMAGKSDSYSVKLAENYLYDFYIRHNIELYEWTQSVLHGKVMLVDSSWATIGSYNLNFLSHYISIELNVDIRSDAFCKNLASHFNTITADYSRVFKINSSGVPKNVFIRFSRWLSYNFFRLIMTIFVSGRKKNKPKKIM